ncbi:MAG: hypothetical protein GXO06_00435 [Epsilonproteobacteria bacterium]|nr:hypothetical protein [Campylobacterota bacterium]
MFNQGGGLMLEQAPPIAVVIRFFITGAIFGILLGVFLLVTSFGIFDISDYSRELIATHFLFLGVEASFMIGALFQMLPVLAGVVIRVPNRKSLIVNGLLILGVFIQAIAFYTSNSIAYISTAIILGGGLLYGVYLMLRELLKVKTHSNTSKGMAFALVAFAITILFGAIMVITLSGSIDTIYNFDRLREFHYSFGSIGWVTLLIIAISFQVVEMFFVTPKYPDILYKYLIVILFALISIELFLNSYIDEVVGALLIIYSIATLYLLYKRRRPTSDATVWFWRFAMGTLILFGVSLYFDYIYLTYMLFISFSLSVIFSMVYKIIPFLVWFHLSSQGYMKAPMMHEVIKPKMAKIHFYIHMVSVTLLLISTLYKSLEPFTYTLWTVSFSFLSWNIFNGASKYRYTQMNSKPMRW